MSLNETPSETVPWLGVKKKVRAIVHMIMLGYGRIALNYLKK